MSTGYKHIVVFDFAQQMLSTNESFRQETSYGKYRFIFKFIKNTVKHKQQNIQYWGGYAKIKPINANIDSLSGKRIIHILFGCNDRISSTRFKGTVNDYGYNTHGKALYHDALLRYNDLIVDSKVVVTIHIRYACRCLSDFLITKINHPQCEVHPKKSSTIVEKGKKNTLPYLWRLYQPKKRRKLNH